MKEEVTIPVGEFCNKIITTQEGTTLHMDKEDIQGFIDMMRGLVNG